MFLFRNNLVVVDWSSVRFKFPVVKLVKENTVTAVTNNFSIFLQPCWLLIDNLFNLMIGAGVLVYSYTVLYGLPCVLSRLLM